MNLTSPSNVLSTSTSPSDNPAALKSKLEKELDMNSIQFNLLYSVYSFPNIILAFFGGALVDRFGTNITLISFVTIITIGQGVFALAVQTQDYGLALAGRAIFGLGGESLAVAQTTLMALWFKGKEVALAMGLNLSVARLGSVINDNVSPALASKYSTEAAVWFGVFVCAFSLLCAVGLVLIEKWAVRKSIQAEDEEALLAVAAGSPAPKRKSEEVKEMVRLQDIRNFPRSYWLLTASCVIVYSAVLPFNNIAGGLMEDQYGYSEDAAGRLLGIPFFISACLSPFLGAIVDRTGNRAYLLVLSAISLVAAHTYFATTPVAWTPYPALVTIGLSYSVYAAAIWPSIALVIEELYLGSAYGVITSVQNGGLALTPVIVGVIQHKTGGYRLVEVFFACIAGVGFIIGIILLSEDKKNNNILNLPTASAAKVGKPNSERPVFDSNEYEPPSPSDSRI